MNGHLLEFSAFFGVTFIAKGRSKMILDVIKPWEDETLPSEIDVDLSVVLGHLNVPVDHQTPGFEGDIHT